MVKFGKKEEKVHSYTPVEGRKDSFAHGLNFYKLFFIFMIGCVVGYCIEMLWCYLRLGYFESRQGLIYGPFSPVYGIGAVIFTVVLYRFRHANGVVIFLASGIIGGVFEYLCSLFQELIFGTVSWEYSDSPLNIGGRTNLMYSFFWGILGLVWVKDLYPALSRRIQKVPKRVGRVLTVVFTVLMAVDVLLSVGAVYRQSERVNDIPADNVVREFFDTYFPDSYLDLIFPHMEYVGKPELPSAPPPKA